MKQQDKKLFGDVGPRLLVFLRSFYNSGFSHCGAPGRN